MSDFKIQPAVVAEFTVTLPDGRSFQVAYLTLQFCATIEQAKARATQITREFDYLAPNDQVLFLKGVKDVLERTVAKDCKIVFDASAGFVRITDKPKPTTGWGS